MVLSKECLECPNSLLCLAFGNPKHVYACKCGKVFMLSVNDSFTLSSRFFSTHGCFLVVPDTKYFCVCKECEAKDKKLREENDNAR